MDEFQILKVVYEALRQFANRHGFVDVSLDGDHQSAEVIVTVRGASDRNYVVTVKDITDG
jgi:hypothetical protein